MRASQLDKNKLLKAIQRVPREYWIKVFSKIRQEEIGNTDDLENEIKYLFATTNDWIKTAVLLYITNYGNNGSLDYAAEYQTINRSELAELKNDLKAIENDMVAEGLTFDKDIQKQINSVSTKLTRREAFRLKIRAKLSYLYSVIAKRIYDHLGQVTEDFYYKTIYEVIKKVGYGSESLSPLELATVTEMLKEVWRSTGETFDDAIWKYGRAFIIELSNLIGRSLSSGLSPNELDTLIGKMFRSKQNELLRLLITDTTFFSTRGQESAFKELRIDEAVYTAILDERTCSVCQDANGTVIPVDKIVPWENAPPLHLYCRCTMIPIITEINYLTGEVYEVESDYTGWYEAHYA